MKIIAGCARNTELLSPPDLGVRPTAVRSRKALFDSIGGRMAGAAVLDLFSGSGALGLESASRGAAEILMVELSPKHISVIENNIRIVQKTGAMAAITLINADVLDLPRYSKRISHADFIFADPPYAVSGELFKKLLALPRFREDFAGAQLFWEIPDTPGAAGDFINCPALKQWQLKDFAGTRFLVGTVAELP
jgi:16S rRNA (guanine966-N2)-methyltransferase